MRRAFEAVDTHVQGDPARVILSGEGLPAVPGATMFEKMKHVESHEDWLRLLMLREPRGFPHLCCNLVVPPTDPRAAAGFIILEQQAYYAAMSGTNTIAVATVLLETGVVEMREPVTEFWLEPPAGAILIRAHCRDGRVLRVDFENAASFVTALDVPLDVPGYGRLTVSVAFGGMAYVLVDAAQLGLAVTPDDAQAALEACGPVCEAANERLGFRHPLNPDLSMIEGLILYRRPSDGGNLRQIPVNAGGTVGRTPAGTGVSATLSVLHARGQCRAGDVLQIEGMFGNPFHCRVIAETTVGGRPAIVPEVGGRAWITARGTYILEEDDPFPRGFMATDLWAIARRGSPAARLAERRR